MINDIDALLFARAMAVAQDPDATVAQMEWVRKFLNDHTARHKDDHWKPDDPAATALKQYGPMDFDSLPLSCDRIEEEGAAL